LNHPDHHGTPDERMKASLSGFDQGLAQISKADSLTSGTIINYCFGKIPN
jgi:hypothetical protein